MWVDTSEQGLPIAFYNSHTLFADSLFTLCNPHTGFNIIQVSFLTYNEKNKIELTVRSADPMIWQRNIINKYGIFDHEGRSWAYKIKTQKWERKKGMRSTLVLYIALMFQHVGVH